MSAIVTPGNLRSTLAVTRSLGRRGIPVTIADERARTLAGSSRYCRAAIRVMSAERNTEAFVNGIRQEACRGGHRVLIPGDDVTLSILAEARAQFDGLVALPFPDVEAIHLAHDKGALMSLAEESGVPIPKTVIIRGGGDLRRAVRQVGFPAVVKPRFSCFHRGGRWVKEGGIHYVHTAAELEAVYRAVHLTTPFPLVQEYIPGEGRGIFLLLKRGNVRAAFAHRRIREKPPSGGVSVLSESVALDMRLLEWSKQLLEAMKWHGVAMVEFKCDERDGIPKLLEINGRFWGSLQLAVDAGIDFPYLLYRLAVDGDVEPVFTYEEGVRVRWWLGDLDWLLLRLRDGGHIGPIREFLTSTGDMTRAEIFRWNDPWPALEELSQYVGHIVRRAIGWTR